MMKVSVIQEHLAKAITTVSRVVGVRSSLPILGNILITAKDSHLTLSATNLEIALSATIGCKVEHPGSVSVPARLLLETVQGLQSEKIQLTGTDQQLDIAAAGTQASIQGMPADEFPAIPEVTPTQTLNLPITDLSGALARVVIAASLDESRPVLAGIFLNTSGEILTLAATDSYRLAEAKIKLGKLEDISVILPLRTIQEVLRLITQTSADEVQIELGTSEARVKVDDVTLITRLIEGTFPNYTQIIPTKFETVVRCLRGELISAVKLASVFARESAHTIKLAITTEGISIHAEAAQVGQNTSEVTATLDGKPTEISLNARFLIDVLNVIDGDEIDLKLNDKLDPCLVVPTDSESSYIHLIMPLRS